MTAAPLKVELGDLTLAPLPPDAHHLLWAWMNEFPKQNFDDYGPKDFDEFLAQVLRGAELGVKIIGVQYQGKWVGAISIHETSPTSAAFRGVCFTRSVHGSGIARLGVSAVLLALKDAGIKKVRAQYFADNRRVHYFLKKLGAVEEGYLKHETTRNGKPVDVRQVAFYLEES